VQSLCHAVTRGVHADTTAEEDADGGRSVTVDDRAHARAEIVETRIPRRRLQAAVGADQRALDPRRVVVQTWECSALRARVPARERVVVVAADAHDLVARDVDEDPADGGADATKAPYGSQLLLGHRDPPPPGGATG
jgi:hypothetical protein